MLTKKCTKCKNYQPLSLFGNLSSSSDRLQYRCKPCRKIDKAEFRKKYPEKVKQYITQWKERNPDKARAGCCRRSQKWYEKNKILHRQKVKKWEDNNPGKKGLYDSIRRFREANQTILLTDMQKSEIVKIYAQAKLITRQTGIQHHVDHIFPLAGKNACGLHVPWNLQIIPAHENYKKSNKMPELSSGL